MSVEAVGGWQGGEQLTRIPAEMELRTPTLSSAALPFCENDLRTPIPIATPMGVTSCSGSQVCSRLMVSP